MKGLPLAYGKDMQEDKVPLFQAFDALALSLAAMTGMVEDLTFNAERAEAAAGLGFATATDLADWLVRAVDLPFRQAHHVTGAAVKRAETLGVELADLPLVGAAGPGASHRRSRLRGALAESVRRQPCQAMAEQPPSRYGKPSPAGRRDCHEPLPNRLRHGGDPRPLRLRQGRRAGAAGAALRRRRPRPTTMPRRRPTRPRPRPRRTRTRSSGCPPTSPTIPTPTPRRRATCRWWASRRRPTAPDRQGVLPDPMNNPPPR